MEWKLSGETTHKITGIILAGGQNRRMDGTNKALMEIQGVSMIERIMAALHTVCADILLVTKEPSIYRHLNVKICRDLSPYQSPLAGIHSGLTHATTDFSICVGCDLPYIRVKVLRLLILEIEPAIDLIVPASGAFFQPLCALYSKRCIAPIEHKLASGDLKIDTLYPMVRVKRISYHMIRQVDPELLSFTNINTPVDFKRATQLNINKE